MARAVDVIVIGGGLAGLAAATALVDGGASVVVLEARATLGGRASSFVDRETGALVDNGQHVVLGCYRETFAYLDRVGARGGIALQSALEMPIVDREGRHSALRCPSLPSPWHLLAGLLGWDALGWRDKAAAVRLAPQLLRARRFAAGSADAPAALGAQTVRSWLQQHGQTRRLNELLWEPFAVAALNQKPDVAAAAPFLRVLGGAFGPDSRDAAVGLPARPLVHVFAEPARAWLEARGARVRVHSPARLLMDGDRSTGVTVRGERLTGGVVVSAVPWFGWRNLVAEHDTKGLLSRIRSHALAHAASPIVTVTCWTARPILGRPFLGLPGRSFEWAFEKLPGHRATWTGARLSLVCSGADEVAAQSDAAIVDAALRDLRSAGGALAAIVPLRTSVLRERQATFSLAPGQPARLGTVTDVPGLFLAGDWTGTGLPATIEGAVLSGHRAANAVLGVREGV